MGRNATIKEQLQAKAVDMKIDDQAEFDTACEHPEETAAAAFEKQPLTADAIDDRIDTAMGALNHVFFEAELRRKGTNGRHYSLDYDGWDNRDDGAMPTDTIEVVDRFKFLNAQVARGLCQTLDNILNQKPYGRFEGGLVQRIEAQRESVRSSIRFGRTQGVDTSKEVDAKAAKLEALLDQQTMVTTALNRAVEAYATLTGRIYESASQRAANKAAVANVTKNDERLARLGV